MMKSDKHIEIVRSAVKGLSCISLVSCDAIRTVLARHYETVTITDINSTSDLNALVARKPDLIFLGMELISANTPTGLDDATNTWITAFLDAHGIAYTGSTQAAHRLARDKSLAKQRVLDAGLRTAPFWIVRQGQSITPDGIQLAFPLFVKPINRGGGVGIDSDSVIHTFEQLSAKVHSITAKLQSDSLIERYLPGREFSVAILKNEHTADFSVMPIELITPPDGRGLRILGNEVKSMNIEQAVEIIDKKVKTAVMDLAINVFHALGARDYGRIDIRMDQYGIPQFLEANLIPSLISGYGSFPKACMLNIGLGYEQMILRIIRLGLARVVGRATSESEDSSRGTVTFSSPELAFKPI